jgi:chromosome segregation protein
MEVADCPLAVLDEVDAALDEVNLRRFSELAKEYAKNRQVLAMTHRRVTMERADVLYGVTLSEPGLSQVIGVRLEDWA